MNKFLRASLGVNVSTNEKLVLFALSSLHGAGVYSATQDRLVLYTSLGKKTLQRAIKMLEARGFLIIIRYANRIKRHGRVWRGNKYQITDKLITKYKFDELEYDKKNQQKTERSRIIAAKSEKTSRLSRRFFGAIAMAGAINKGEK